MTRSRPDAADLRQQRLEEFALRGAAARRPPRLEEAAVEAIEALRSAGIAALLLKGAALADALYAPDRHRYYFDVDLMVAPEHHEAAGTVLAGLGYRDISTPLGVDDVAGVVHSTMWSRVDQVIGNITIDLHWKLAGCAAPADDVWRAISEDPGQVMLAGRPAPRLGDTALALHVALHLAQHGPDDEKAVIDLRLALDRWPSTIWEQAARLAAEVSAAEAFAAGLRVLPEGEGTADLLGLGSGEQVLWDLRHRAARPRGTFHLSAFADATTFRERADILRRAIFPSRAWIADNYRWARAHSALISVAYLLHVMRAPQWAWRAFRFLRQRPR